MVKDAFLVCLEHKRRGCGLSATRLLNQAMVPYKNLDRSRCQRVRGWLQLQPTLPQARTCCCQCRLHDAFDQECARRKRWTDENVRRRHNYIPFIFNLLKTLGSRGQLQSLIDASKAAGAV